MASSAVQEGCIEALAACMKSHLGKQGLHQQVRITAAAALVPLLGESAHITAYDTGVPRSGTRMYQTPSPLRDPIAKP